MKLSDLELQLLRELQRDASLSLTELSDRCGMAQSTVWRKVQELSDAGIIHGRVALLDASKLGLKLSVLANITLNDHSEATIENFTSLVARHPEIMECHKVSGGADYILKIRTADVESYEAFMSQHLLRSRYIRGITSSFVLKEIKSTIELPL